MKRKLFFLLLSGMLFSNIQLMAQWNLNGNNAAAADFLGTLNAQPLVFKTNGAAAANERGRITPAGEWGIGTSAPATKLHINSSIAGLNPLRVDVAGVPKLWVSSISGGTTVGANLTAPANGIYVSGSAGFGTNNPAGKVHIFHNSSAANPQLLLFENANDFARLNFKNTNTANYFTIAGSPAAAGASAKLHFFYNPIGNIMTVQGDGKVGIGVAAPTEKLQVAGNIDFDGDGTELKFHNAQFFRDAPANANLEIQTHGDLVPDNACLHDLGTPSLTWKNLYLCGSIIQTSDARSKENVQNITYGLKEILKIRPVSYSLIENPESKKSIGLIAQEVQAILPEMVSDSRVSKDELTGKVTNSTNSILGIQYTAFIPVIIKAIQEQQALIETKDKQLSDLQNQSKQLQSQLDQLQSLLVKKGVVSKNDISNGYQSNAPIPQNDPVPFNREATVISGASLEQNEPNPFNEVTTLRYSIPTGAKAQILITDIAGMQVKSMEALASGQVQINANELQPGIYIYSLEVDGQKVASKRMVLSR